MEFKNIYVDIEQNSISEFKDSNGVVICDNSTEQGIITNPIGFDEFREYLRIDHGIDQTYYLKGKIIFPISNSLSANDLGKNILFETPHSNRNIKITSWKNFVEYQLPFVTQLPFGIWVESGGEPSIYIASNGDNLEISNANIELYDSQLIFGHPINNNNDINEPYRGNLSLINTKLQTNMYFDGGNNSFTFYNFKNVLLDYCLLNVQCTSGQYGSVVVDNDTDVATIFNIRNSFIIRTCNFASHMFNYSYKKSKLNINSCVFSDSVVHINIDVSPLSDIYHPLDFVKSSNEFSWNISALSELNEYLYITSQYSKYDYITWACGVSGIKDSYGSEKYCHSPYRDGIGPLSFTPLPNFRVICNPLSGALVGNVIAVSAAPIKLTEYDYSAPFSSIELTVSMDGEVVNVVSESQSDYVEFIPNAEGNLKIDLTLNSVNNWYKKTNTIYYNVFSSAVYGIAYNFDYDVYCIKNVCSGSQYILASATNVSAFEVIMVSAYNNSVLSEEDLDNPVPTIKRYYIDYDNNINYSFHNWYVDGDQNFQCGLEYPGSSILQQYKYSRGDAKYITMFVQFQNNVVVSKTKRVNIINQNQKQYYVDISKYYEDSTWWEKESYLTDQFDNGLQSYWSTDILTSANIKSIGNGNSLSTNYNYTDLSMSAIPPKGLRLLKNNIDTDMICEFSLVRNDRESKPKFTLVDENLNIHFYIEWDYLKELLNIGFVGPIVENKVIKYSLNALGFSKDLRCSNGLNTMHFKITQTNFDVKKFRFYYKFQENDSWIEYSNFDNNNYILNALNFIVFLNSYTGIGYINLQSKCGLPIVTGTQSYPFTYKLFYDRIKKSMVNDIAMSRGDYNDLYYLKGIREITEFILHNKFYNVDSWNAFKYGNYVLVYDSVNSDMILSNSTFSNGIIYNIANDNYVTCKLRCSNLYDMFITWNKDSLVLDSITDINNALPFYCNSKDSRIFNTIASRYNICGNTIKLDKPVIM